MSKLKIEHIEIEKINPAKYNPRDISELAFEGLKESIKKWGVIDPLIVNIKGNVLVGGHQRLKAASALNYKTIPVVFVDLCQAEEKALNVTLNSPKISGKFTDGLQQLLEEIKYEIPEFDDLLLGDLAKDLEWQSDLTKIDKTESNLDAIPSKIIITCRELDKDAVLFYIKDKLMETSFEGIHIE